MKQLTNLWQSSRIAVITPSKQFLTGIKYAITFSLILGLNGCATSPDDVKEIYLVIDLSGSLDRSQIPSAQYLYNYIVQQELEIIEEDDITSKGLIVSLSTIGDISRPPVEVIKLESGAPWLIENQTERLEHINNFKGRLLAALEQWLSIPSDKGKTYLQCSLAYQCELMSKSSFSQNKQIYLFSDGLETNEQVSFENYAAHIDSFRNDFTAISDILNRRCALPNLDGYTITFINRPTQDNDAIVRPADDFWEQHLEKYGAEVIIRSNLM